ncbi:MAG: hypothetical protein ABIH72_03465 [archaeon]
MKKLIINEEKFKIFLEAAKLINKKFNISPVIYGSLGLQLKIGEFSEANDIDILIADEYIGKKWLKLISLMKELNYNMIDEHEHEFKRKNQIVAFAKESILFESGTNPNKLEETKIKDISFRQLNAKQYLKAYETVYNDDYRRKKQGQADDEKIKLIKKYLNSS